MARAAAIKKVSANARTRADFAKLITEAWQGSLEGIFRTGNMLETAKAELPHGEWLLMIKNDLQFEPRTAQRLIEIARHESISDATHVSHLPVAWGTLYELSKLDEETFEAAIADGRINPKMERKQAVALRTKPEAEPKPKRVLSAVDRCGRALRDLIFEYVDQLEAPGQWPELIAELRDQLNDMENYFKKREADHAG
jgi:hypothetical protein